MLTVGLVTEAIIFFFSAFEPLHVEPDWSLVYPEMWDLYHGNGSNKAEKPAAGAKTNTTTNANNGDLITNKINEMFEKANINSMTIERIGAGLNKLGENAGKIADVTDAVVATNNYAKAMNKASETVIALDEQMVKSASGAATLNDTNKRLNDSMALYIEKVNASANNTETLNIQLNDMAKRMSAMNNVYGNMLNAMNIKA